MIDRTLQEDSIMATHPTEPRLLPHHGGQSWTSFWRDDSGRKRTKRFGKSTEVSAKEARIAYRNWVKSEWEEKDHVRNPDGDGATYTINHLAGEFRAHCEGVYRKNGEPTSHIYQVGYAMDALSGAYGHLPADAAEAPQIANLRDAMIFDAAGKPLSFKTVNGRLHLIKQSFAWAREKGKVGREVAYDISLVKPLRKGRSAARDPKKVSPVAWDVVEDTKRCASSVVADMIELQWLTGMRPEEVCIMRGSDIEAGGEAWLYRPGHHKTEHMDQDRVVAMGPLAQAIVKRRTTTDTAAYLFSPAESAQERRELRTANRKTKASYGNGVGTNRVTRPSVIPGDCYSTESYRKAIHHACDLAWPFPGQLGAKAFAKLSAEDRVAYLAERLAWRQAHRWGPNQLRHAWATRVRKQFGIEEASVGLGHSNLNTTQIYAERSLAKAIEVARKVG